MEKSATQDVINDLRRALVWADLVLAHLKEAVVVFDKNRKILFVNDAFSKLVSIQRIFLLNSSVNSALPFMTSFELLETNMEAQCQYKNPDGLLLDLELSASFIEETGQTIIVLRDITSRLFSSKAEAEKTKELEKLNQLMIGRELRMVELKKQLTHHTGGDRNKPL